MLLEELLPSYDAREIHRTRIRATPKQVFTALETADLGSTPVKVLLTLRAVPFVFRGGRGVRMRLRKRLHEPVTLATLEQAGFGRVAYAPGRELVLGIEGRFWELACVVTPVGPDQAKEPVPLRSARALWNFSVEPCGPTESELRTETRVQCGDSSGRRRFRHYWWIVRPGSGLLRRLMLRAVRRAAEKSAMLA